MASSPDGRLARVMECRAIQQKRFTGRKSRVNARMSSQQFRQFCTLDSEGEGMLRMAMDRLNFSARAHDRILKVARTLSDLAGSPDIRPNDILEAIQYRSLDRKLFN